MTKKERQQVFDKYGGRCAYCGEELQKGWHVDHIEPIRRHFWKNNGDCDHPEREHIGNYMPACASCNISKHSGSIEDFRNLIAGFIPSLNRYSTQYKIAKRYGLVSENNNPVTFYFETVTCNAKP